MGSPMSFWAVEVKPGVSQKVQPDDNKIIHISQAALGEAKKDKGSDNVPVFVKCGDQKIVLGSLSSEKFPQIACDLVFDHEFELSHNFKNTSVYFSGYTVVQGESDDDFGSEGCTDSEPSDSDSDSEEELPLAIAENGKPKSKVVEETKPANATKSQKPKVKVVEPSKDKKPVEEASEDADSDDDLDDSGSEDDESDDEEMNDVGTDSDSDSDSDDEDDGDDEDDEDEDEEETPKKSESSGKKRPNDSATKTPVPAKKAKAVSPQKTDGKKGGHTATPHPSKQVAKTSGKSEKKPQTPKSGGEVVCSSCSKTFKSDGALQAHSKAKHSASK